MGPAQWVLIFETSNWHHKSYIGVNFNFPPRLFQYFFFIPIHVFSWFPTSRRELHAFLCDVPGKLWPRFSLKFSVPGKILRTGNTIPWKICQSSFKVKKHKSAICGGEIKRNSVKNHDLSKHVYANSFLKK